MFGFFKKRARKEHFRLLAECKQMASRLLNVAVVASSTSTDDLDQSLAMIKDLKEVLAEIDKNEMLLETNDLLEPETVSGYLDLHRVLTMQVYGMEKGREEARKRFS